VLDLLSTSGFLLLSAQSRRTGLARAAHVGRLTNGVWRWRLTQRAVCTMLLWLVGQGGLDGGASSNSERAHCLRLCRGAWLSTASPIDSSRVGFARQKPEAASCAHVSQQGRSPSILPGQGGGRACQVPRLSRRTRSERVSFRLAENEEVAQSSVPLLVIDTYRAHRYCAAPGIRRHSRRSVWKRRS
jgi:hypothetical protein